MPVPTSFHQKRTRRKPGNILMKSQKVVAVIDDDPIILKAITRLLKVHGFRSKVFASAEAFLESAFQIDVGCLVLDIHLDGMSGIELAESLKACNSGTPIVFVTAAIDEETRQRATKAGCVAYLSKPFSAKLLIAAIDKVTG
ncbi:MAG TPA: response regulator [Xanthobacteraceae bacterium]